MHCATTEYYGSQDPGPIFGDGCIVSRVTAPAVAERCIQHRNIQRTMQKTFAGLWSVARIKETR